MWKAARGRAKISSGDHLLNSLPIAAGLASAAVATAVWGSVAASSQLYGPTWRHTPNPKQLALTFDDGPNPSVTPMLLDLLDRHSARASFFVLGKFARACPDLIRETSARGHALGNHTESHSRLVLRTRAGIRDELQRCQDAVATALHAEPPQWMRPPFGYRKPGLNAAVHRVGLRGVVMWSLICQDWKPQPTGRLIKKLSKSVRPRMSRGDIVLLHDGDHRALGANRDSLLAALEYWLPRWRDAGMEFVTIDSLEAGAPA